jgi:hypothetical protein
VEQFIYFRRPPEAVPILKDESTSGEIVVAANGRTPESDVPREEDIQRENIHSSSTRGAIAQVSLTTSETSYVFLCYEHCYPLSLVRIF